MPDSPSQAPASSKGSGLGAILSRDIKGIPVWMWLVIGGAGLALGYFFLKRQNANKSTGTQSSGAATDASTANGLGLAIDPTTGLPYGVEGLVPSGANAGAGTDFGSYANLLNQIQQEITALQQPPATTTTTTTGTTTAYAHSTKVHDLAKQLGVTYDQLVKALFAESKGTGTPYATLVTQIETGKEDVTTLKKYLPKTHAPHNPIDLNGATGPAVHPVPQNTTP